MILVGKKCKCCGFYEKDMVKLDDVFDEWEFCLLDFSLSLEGFYFCFKENEFNFIFLCLNCSKFNCFWFFFLYFSFVFFWLS